MRLWGPVRYRRAQRLRTHLPIALLVLVSGSACERALQTSCTDLWPDLPSITPLATSRTDLFSLWGEPNETMPVPGTFTPGGEAADTVLEAPAYALPTGHVLLPVFRPSDDEVVTLMVSPPSSLPTDSVIKGIGKPDSIAQGQESDGRPFEQWFWWTDHGSTLRLAVIQDDSLLMLVCGLVGGS